MKNNIEELLNKYFEGETTCEEERQLRRFFAKGLVPEHLEVYCPMFAFLGKRRKTVQVLSDLQFRRSGSHFLTDNRCIKRLSSSVSFGVKLCRYRRQTIYRCRFSPRTSESRFPQRQFQ